MILNLSFFSELPDPLEPLEPPELPDPLDPPDPPGVLVSSLFILSFSIFSPFTVNSTPSDASTLSATILPFICVFALNLSSLMLPSTFNLRSDALFSTVLNSPCNETS